MFSLVLPLNSVSYGQMCVGLTFEIYERGLTPNIFPIGQVDLSAYDLPNGYTEWLNYCVKKAHAKFKRSEPCLKIWHIEGLKERISDYQVVWTAHETNMLTDEEANILRNVDKVFGVSNYVTSVFRNHDVDAHTCHNFFDSRHLKKEEVKRQEDVTHWTLIGKIEKRKKTIDVIKAWCKKYANHRQHILHLSIDNPWLLNGEPDPIKRNKMMMQYVAGAIGGLPANINFIPHVIKNSEMNQVYNVADVNLSGCSGAEGFNLPFFNSLCLGKQAVGVRAHAHLDFASNENSILFEPRELIDISDGLFFSYGGIFNQGKMYDWDEDKVIEAMEKAEKIAKVPNPEGEKLAEKFSVKNTANILLKALL